MKIWISRIVIMLASFAMMHTAFASDPHDEHGHEEKGHEEKGHEAHGDEEQGHEENGHEAHGDEEQGHEENGHGAHGDEEKGHEENGHGAHGDEEKGHEEKGHEAHGDEEQGHEENGHGAHGDEEQSVKLTPEQIKLAGIVVNEIQLQNVSEIINAPGEIVLNAYKTTSVTPRVSAQVIRRYAKLGDAISTGQPLLTLSSVEMASAQGDLLISEREWKRVKKLGKKVVSGQRYTQARVAHEQAKARVLAYGMTDKQAQSFMKSGNASAANGTFQLLAPQDGTVIQDNFIVGELIEPGRELFVISDESTLWVEAKLTPAQVKDVAVGNDVSIIADNEHLSGKVVQIHHALDEDTRTLGVRIEVANPDDELHPGVFVKAQISSNNTDQALAVPTNTVLRSPDGDWMVFTEHKPGEFEPQEIEVIKTVGKLVIIEGIEAGTRVVIQGAFFVQSELAKSGFEIHNH